MTTIAGSFRRRLLGRSSAPEASHAVADQPTPTGDDLAPVDLAPNDPLLAFLQSANGVVDVDTLELDSPGLVAMKEAGVKLAVPLVSQGELIGVLSLGPRRSEQEYSSDDRTLLDALAAQAAPAVRVGQLVRQQQAEARTRERIDQELEVARLIQQNFLPQKLPELPGWEIAALYRPAREVGGDFYDVIPLPDGHFGFVVGDVTDKGVPAALVMAATRSVLRASAQRLVDPGLVLPARQGNERRAIERVSTIVAPLGLSEARQRRLETAVGEAAMNAMEHGNHFDPDKPVSVRVVSGPEDVRVQIVDHGGAPASDANEVPDLEAKLAGLQRARGWGLFLIKEMVDEAHESSDGRLHTLELLMRLHEPADHSAPEAGDDDDDE